MATKILKSLSGVEKRKLVNRRMVLLTDLKEYSIIDKKKKKRRMIYMLGGPH